MLSSPRYRESYPLRIIIFTGKGGSGVSTLAAATAAAAAQRGHRTLAFGLAGGLAPIAGLSPAAGLTVLDARPGESDPFRRWLRDLLDWRNIDPALADDLAALPGLSLVSGLLELEARIEGGEWDVIVVDGPPLGACVDLLAALDGAARWLDQLFPPRQPTVFEPFLRALTAYASNGEDVYENGRDLLSRLARLRDLLTDAEASSVRLVLPADRSAVAEAQQALSALALFAYPVDAAIVGRLLPANVTDPFFAAALARQEEARRFLAESLAPLPLLSVHLVPEPGAGPPALSRLAAQTYAEHDPSAVLYRGPVHAYSQQGGQHVLSLAVPFARREDLSLEQDGDGLVVRLGGRRRVIPLPPEAESRAARSSSFDGQTLKVVFG